ENPRSAHHPPERAREHAAPCGIAVRTARVRREERGRRRRNGEGTPGERLAREIIGTRRRSGRAAQVRSRPLARPDRQGRGAPRLPPALQDRERSAGPRLSMTATTRSTAVKQPTRTLSLGLMLILLAGAASPAAAQGLGDGLKRRAKEKVEQRAERRADQAMDKALDKAENAVSCAVTDARCIENAEKAGQPVVVTRSEEHTSELQ